MHVCCEHHAQDKWTTIGPKRRTMLPHVVCDHLIKHNTELCFRGRVASEPAPVMDVRLWEEDNDCVPLVGQGTHCGSSIKRTSIKVSLIRTCLSCSSQARRVPTIPLGLPGCKSEGEGMCFESVLMQASLCVSLPDPAEPSGYYLRLVCLGSCISSIQNVKNGGLVARISREA